MASTKPAQATGPDDAPGEPTHTLSKVLETGASMVQRFDPIKQIGQHLCGIHFYHSDMSRQVEAHHFCSHVNEDIHQCVIYDSDRPDARLIGVEFVVSEKIFLALPDEEKKLWHSHDYEVTSGLLTLPAVPAVAERAVMAKLAKTYGKTWHFWQFDRGDALPLGAPQLMASFTDDGQVLPKVVQDIESKYDVTRKGKREDRVNLKGPDLGVHPLADYWKSGKGIVTELREVDFKEHHTF
eukprot:jgi/Mesen1/8650/ME000502S08010